MVKKIIYIVIIFFVLCTSTSCISQTKKENTVQKKIIKTIKKDITKHFNIEDYENLKKDPEFSNSKDDTQYIFGDKRIRVYFYLDKGIRVDETSRISPLKTIKGFSQKTKLLQLEGYYFYDFMCGIWKNYDEQGKLIKETNYDLPYKFSVEDLKKKMLKEYDIDIMDVNKIAVIRRFVIHEHNNTPFYEVYVKTGKPNETDQYVIHGTTGEILLTDTEYRDEKGNSPYERYLNKESRQENLHTRYKGKDYTKEEWEAYQKTDEYKKDNPSVWDIFFGKKNKK